MRPANDPGCILSCDAFGVFTLLWIRCPPESTWLSAHYPGARPRCNYSIACDAHEAQDICVSTSTSSVHFQILSSSDANSIHTRCCLTVAEGLQGLPNLIYRHHPKEADYDSVADSSHCLFSKFKEYHPERFKLKGISASWVHNGLRSFVCVL